MDEKARVCFVSVLLATAPCLHKKPTKQKNPSKEQNQQKPNKKKPQTKNKDFFFSVDKSLTLTDIKSMFFQTSFYILVQKNAIVATGHYRNLLVSRCRAL